MRCLLASLAAGIVTSAFAAPEARAEGEWQLVWSDEFEGDAIDSTKWGFEIDCWGGGNDERQCYTDNARNAMVKDGELVITARKEQATGVAIPERLREEGVAVSLVTKSFTSARMTTRGMAAWRYGKIEVRAKLPQGQGTWPAIWMLPEKDQYGRWAASGEIDILEAVNLGVECKNCAGGRENKIFGTLHFGGEWPDNKFDSTEIDYPGVLEGYHVFAIEWRKGKINWMVDGQIFATKQAADWSTVGSKDQNAPFDQPFHLILNLAIGGGLPEGRNHKGVSLNDFPKELLVDWVRVFQWSSNPETDEACADQ